MTHHMPRTTKFKITVLCTCCSCLSTVVSEILREGHWGDTRSGPGSTVPSTIGVRLAVEEVIRDHRVTSMLDAPCGDLTWMPLVRGIDRVRYTGADISTSIVNENRRKFPPPQNNERWGGEATTTREREHDALRRAGGFQGAVFVQADLVESVPPSVYGEPYDLIFVRSVAKQLIDCMVYGSPWIGKLDAAATKCAT